MYKYKLNYGGIGMKEDKFSYKEEGEIVETSKRVADVVITPLYVACSDLGIRQKDYLLLKSRLTKEEFRILDVIRMDSEGQCRLYITEMCKMLHKRRVLPTQYLNLIR